VQTDWESSGARLAEAEERFEQEEWGREDKASRLRVEVTRHKEMEGKWPVEIVIPQQSRYDLEATQQLIKLPKDKVQRLEATEVVLKTTIDAC
jgi:hypothetical protein